MLRFKKGGGRKNYETLAQAALPLLQSVGGEPILSLTPEVPVLSEEFWEHCVLTRFPSINEVVDLYSTDAWQSQKVAQKNVLENSLSVATQSIPLPK